MRVWVLRAVILAVGVAVSSCDKGLTDPSENKKDVFSDTLHKVAGGEAKVHFFTVSRNGEYTVTLDSLTPPLIAGGVVQVQVNAVVNGSCNLGVQIVDANGNATAGRQALPFAGSPLITPGQFCVAIADRGFLSGDTVYQLTVSHP